MIFMESYPAISFDISRREIAPAYTTSNEMKIDFVDKGMGEMHKNVSRDLWYPDSSRYSAK